MTSLPCKPRVNAPESHQAKSLICGYSSAAAAAVVPALPVEAAPGDFGPARYKARSFWLRRAELGEHVAWMNDGWRVPTNPAWATHRVIGVFSDGNLLVSPLTTEPEAVDFS